MVVGCLSRTRKLRARAFTFYASEDKLTNCGNRAGATIGVEKINREAAKLAREVRRGLRHGLHCTSLHCPGGRRGRRPDTGRDLAVPLLPVRHDQGRRAEGVLEADRHLCVREDGLPAVRGKNRHGRHLNCLQKYLTESRVAVLRAHRGDGVGDRGVPEDQPACGRLHVHRAGGRHYWKNIL